MEISVFVIMPFSKESFDRYELAIKSSCDNLNLNCSRVDEQIFQENILERIYKQIAQADIIISDMTGKNPNVFFEAGYAKALGKRIIFLTDESSNIPFDLKQYPHIVYSNSLVSLKNNLTKTLKFYTDEITLRNFKVDSSNIAGGIIDSNEWMIGRVGGIIENIFLKTDSNANQDLVNRIEHAKEKFNAFGLTRNFYISDFMYNLLLKKALQIPIKLFLMNPNCDSRTDRYRLEPVEAALENPTKYKTHVESKYKQLISEVNKSPKKNDNAGLEVFYFNFPCSFALEEIDSACRVMLYGHNKRGTDSPIFVFGKANPYYEYFSSQIRWLENLSKNGGTEEPWKSKGIIIEKMKEN